MLSDEERKKFKPLYTITVQYDYEGETKLWKQRNMTSGEMMDLRERMFSTGLAVLYNTGHWVVIHPRDLGTIEIYLQKKYFE